MKIFWENLTLLTLLVVLGCDDEQYYQGFPMTSRMEESQQSSDGKENGYDFVDLGLPSGLKWAMCNVGASKPEEYGSYFAWGETTPKNSYSWSNLKYCLDSNGNKFSKYVSGSSYGTVDNRTTLELSDDAAHANWGGSWRMPTSQEIDELIDNCTWVRTSLNGVKGYKVTGKKEGYTDKSIFLPSAGRCNGSDLGSAGSGGHYWSSSLYKSNNQCADQLSFDSGTHNNWTTHRFYGQSVRPVCPSEGYVSVSSVSLNTSSVSLEVGGTSTLTATVSPSNATDKSVQWSSSNTSVATVDSNGKVTAKSAGTATITVTTTDGNKTSTCTVTVKSQQSSEGSENGHDYVDLGLPSGLKWATCNVGANNPEEYGSYFAWGETTSKSTYDWSTYKYCKGSYSTMTKYCTSSSYGTVDNKTTLELSDDAARANWGGNWRMPTDDEFGELLNNCTWTWTTQNGVNGYKVTSKKSGYTDKSIFLPAAGCRIDDSLYNAGSCGNYWSSSLSTGYSDDAFVLYFYSGSHRRNYYRYYGQSVRPVCPSEGYVSVAAVSLNTSSLSLEVGGTTTLTATVSPSNATDKSVQWSSNNTSVATVDSNGKVTAKSAGTATITVTTTDGSKTATCTVTVKSQQSSGGKENGHEYVDLGLSVKWATCNVGADKPEDYGSYFAWGETTTKSNYSWSNLKYCLDSNGDKFSKYVYSSSYGTVDNRTTLELSDDAARANWGGSWRMPTITEIDELLNNCTWEWTTQNGVYGYKVTGKKAGYTDKSIFLPAAGYRSYGLLYNAGSDGSYWSSSLGTNYGYYAYVLYFFSSNHDGNHNYRCYGQSVRPVCPSDNYVSVTGVKLNTSSLSLEEGGTTTLTATVSPSNATDKSVTWKSSNTSVATVDTNGKITAKSAGTATITVTTTDGNFTATCTVTVTSPLSSSDGKENGHDYVDLGLPSGIKWATCNIGASKPEDYGSYFAWGETVGDPYIKGKDEGYSKSFDWSTYKYCNGSSSTMTKYCTSSSYGIVDNRTTLELTDDAAHVNWGGSWRMPTDAEIGELRNNCTWTWTTQNGVYGYKVTGKKAGYTDKSIFLPAAGYRGNDLLYYAGSDGLYWSSSLNASGSSNAYVFYFYSSGRSRSGYSRFCGRSVRAVCPSDNYVSVTGVKLNTTSLSLEVGGTATLTATVSPSNATDKSVTWKSSNTSVATVDTDGKITAKSAGTATITVTTTDGNKTATCTVTVKSTQSSDGSENGHDYVDLGLPSGLKWATCNVGANNPEEYGSYFAWGETTSKSTYDWSTYKYCKGSYSTMTKYCTSSSYGTVDNKTTLELSDDAARANWGGSWRMPTSQEIDELLNNCTWTWTNQNGINGYKVTSKKSGYTDKSVFLPAAGCRDNDNLSRAGSNGYYWSSSLDANGSNFAYDLYFYSGSHYRLGYYRYYGQSVRPVCPSEGYVSVSSVSLNTSSVSLEVGGTSTLTATVSPSNATDKSVQWSSNNTSVATVDANGKVTAKSAGTAIITVTTTDGSNTATCTVTVKSTQIIVSSVSLNTSSVSLEEGGTATLTATVSPSNATDRSVTWKSGNTTVATVDSNGKVTAKSAGTTTITVTTTDGNKTATCTVTVKSPQSSDGKENGHDYVDLGLPSGVKWATCNIGASNPEEYGSYFAWGETVGDPYIKGKDDGYSKSFYWSTYKYCNGSSTTMTKYCTNSGDGTVDNKTTLELSDDAARANWGGSWRMPTITEIDELLNNCTWTWTTQNGVYGYKVTGKKAGYTDKSIFLPAAGFRNDDYLYNVGSSGIYWSSSLNTNNSNNAYGLGFYSSDHYRSISSRFYGLSVRPVCPSDNYVSVTAVKLNTTSVSLEVGGTTTLTATVSPSNATDKSVTWKSSNTSVATVDTNGKITAKSAGTATITVTTTDGSKTATCTVTVKSPQVSVTGVTLFQQSLQLIVGESAVLTATVSPSNATDKSVTWKSNNTSVATVDSDGKITAKSAGTAVITVTTTDGSKTATCTFTVKSPQVSVTGVTLSQQSLQLIVGESAVLTATVSPSNATDKSVTWKSSNTSVATVDTNGKITAKSAGTAVITVTTTDGSKTATCTFTVKSPQVSVTGVTLSQQSLQLIVGESTVLTATVSPSNATDKRVTWKSSNTSVATVDSDGKITAKSAGTATITVTTTDGSKTATCTVTVKSQQSSGGKENGHEYVDLGLSVKWATCNVGADKPEDYGSYFAWGETTTKSSYTWSNLTYCLDSNGNKFSKYVSNSSYGTVDNKTTLELSDDAARANWGGSWRMPTITEIDELLNNCTWTWTTQNGVYGYKVTGKKAGYTDKSIFLPAAGCRFNGGLYNAGSGGYYWSSSLRTGYSYGAYELDFNWSDHYRGNYDRYCGQSVRPVCP